jgi:hypothetical protein
MAGSHLSPASTNVNATSYLPETTEADAEIVTGDFRSGSNGEGNGDTSGPSRASPELDAAEIEGQYSDPTSGLTFLHRAYRRFSSNQRRPAVSQLLGSSSEDHQQQELMTAGDLPFVLEGPLMIQLPDRRLASELMNFYFDVCVVTYRILHRGITESWLDAMLFNQETGRSLTYGVGNGRAAIVLTIMAVVTYRRAKIMSHENYETSPSDGDIDLERLRQSDHFFCAARQLATSETGLPRLESAQARLIQVLYLLQTSRMNQGWYVFGMTCQIISALGLHRRGSKKRSAGLDIRMDRDYISSQCRKRVFWVAYTIDQYLSVVFGRPRNWHDEDIDQDFPDCINDEDMDAEGPANDRDHAEQDCHMDAVVFHAKLAQALSTISHSVYSIQHLATSQRIASASRALADLHEWRAQLPPHLGTVRPSSLVPSFRRQATALRLAYHHAVLHATRPFLLLRTRHGRPKQRSDDRTSNEGGERREGEAEITECISAASQLLSTFDGMAAAGGAVFHAFWWSSYVVFCALTVVYVWEIQQGSAPAGSTGGRALDEQSGDMARLMDLAERCRGHLSRSTAASSPSRRYSIILEELRAEAQLQKGRAPVSARERYDDRPDGAIPLTEASSMAGLLAAQEGQPADMQMSLQPTFAYQQGNDGLSGEQMNGLLVGWQTSDWLDLDSSVSGRSHSVT